MTFDLFWMDVSKRDEMFGFGLITIHTGYIFRSLFSVWWTSGDLIIDMFWFRIMGKGKA